VLEVLEKSVDGYVRFEDFTYNSYIYAKGYDRILSKSGLSKAISRLKENGLIEKQVKSDNEIIFQLTDQGKSFILESSQDVSAWDGKWRIVLFDIPEQKRVIRNLFRRNLKKWGFKPLQKSVWVSKHDVYTKLEGYIKELGIEKWVSIIETNKISHITF